MKIADTNLPARLPYIDKRWQYAAAVLSLLAGWIHVFFAQIAELALIACLFILLRSRHNQMTSTERS